MSRKLYDFSKFAKDAGRSTREITREMVEIRGLQRRAGQKNDKKAVHMLELHLEELEHEYEMAALLENK